MTSTFVYGWGNVGDGQLGLGGIEEEQIYSPREITLLMGKKILDIATSFSHSVFLTEDGVLYSCGNNDYRQLGHEKTRKKPETVDALETHIITQAKCGKSHSAALTNQGQVMTWGNNEMKQLGRTSSVSTTKPVKFPGNGTSLVQIACGYNHTIALADDGRVFTWGSDSCGQLGLGVLKENVNPSEPQHVASLLGLTVSGLSAGSNHSFVVTASGALLGWGDNKFGQLGVGDKVDRHSPELCSSLRTQNVIYVCCGENHTAVLTQNGGVFTFGAGMYGQLGHGNVNSETNPKKIFELMGDEVSMIACGRNHTVAYIKSKDRVYTFGLGSNGQLGFNSRSNFHIPTALKILTSKKGSKVRSLHAGGDQTFVIFSSDERAYPQVDNREIIKRQQIEIITPEFVEKISSCANISDDIEKKMKKIFSSPSCINGSFYRKSSGPYCDTKDHGVDIQACRKAFQLISKSKCKLAKDLLDGFIENCFIPNFPTKLLDIEGMRLFIMLPVMHFFENTTSYAHSVLHPLLRRLLQLDVQQGKVLENWWQVAGTDYIIYFVKSLKNLLCEAIRMHKEKNIFGGNVLFVCLEVLRKIHFIVESARLPLDYELFYVKDLHDLVQLELDYIIWIGRARLQTMDAIIPLSFEREDVPFCNYPFIFDGQSKTILLRTDAHIQMRIAMDNSMMHNLASLFLPVDQVNPDLFLVVSRDNIVQDTIDQLTKYPEGDYKKPLRIKFLNEGAVDAGGVKKEFFMLLLKDLLDPKYGMFRYYEESRLVWINADTFELESMYHLVGVVCGLAIYNDNIISMNLPLVLFKKLLMRPATLEDLKELEPTVGKSLQTLLDYKGNDVEDVFGLTFEITRDIYGKLVTTPLVPGGSEKVVNKANRSEYVNAYIDNVFNESVKVQFNEFRTGFMKVCGGRILELFQPKELQAMVVGNENYNWNELEKNAGYIKFTADHPTIKLFWEVFRELKEEEKKKFLLFLTGCDRIPILGMKAIHIKIQQMGGSEDLLPVAHTCFNVLDLPLYKTKATLKKKLLQAIEHTQGFGLA